MPVARSVAEDLEVIFPEESSPHGPTGRRLRLGIGHAPRAVGSAGRGERRLANVGALTAAVCLGLSAGAVLSRTDVPARHAPQAMAGSGVAIAASAPALPAPGPLFTPALVTPFAAPVAVFHAAGPPAKAAAETPKVRRVSAARASAPRPKATRVASTCAHQSSCSRRALMAADARLRRAYVSAADAGVEPAVLENYRDEWNELRLRAPQQPALVTAQYRRMAGSLSHMAAEQRAAQAERPRPGPFKRLGMQLAALWR
jgi:hypothetical protein